MKPNYIEISVAFIIILLGFVVYYGSGTVPSDFKFEGEVKTINQESDHFDIEAEYPQKDILGAEKVRSFIDKKVGDFKDLAARGVSELRERGFDTKYSLFINLENYQSENYLSHVLFISEYTGGANVNQIAKSFVYNKVTGDEVSISGVVPEDEAESFVDKVKGDLYSREGQIGIFPDSVDNLSIDSFDSFYVTDNDIVLVFSKYEVAPGASGIVKVNIPR